VTERTPHLAESIEFRISDLGVSIDWSSMFGNENPVEVEIGCGKGRFTITSAETFHDVNYVGIERAPHYFRLMKERVAKRGLGNVRLLMDDGGYLVEKFIADQSVSAYHIYFPDPWPKKRHRKRRLIKPVFIDQVVRTLIEGGTLDIATDYEQYFDEATEFLNGTAALKKMDMLPERVRTLGTGMTNFEVKYVAEGREIYRAGYQRR
jgi:tRNA (guanine-N7-)-methyltransferase